MKSVILALLAPVAIADCILKGGLGKLDVTCSIPKSTTISSKCCNSMQGMIDKVKPGEPPEPPTPEEQQALMMHCQSFQMYVMQRMPHGTPPESPEEEANMIINALPDGLSCTETVAGGGESACALHAQQGKLGVTCDIPKETKITPECCSVIQGGIDKSGTSENPPSPQEQQKAMQACSSVEMYVMQKESSPQPTGPITPEDEIDMLPSGLSCKAEISSDKMLSLYANRPILSTITLVARFGKVNISEKASAMPPVISGIAGFLAGGMLMAGVLFRYSWKQSGNQYHLLSEPHVA
jgi:hypothetical protein